MYTSGREKGQWKDARGWMGKGTVEACKRIEGRDSRKMYGYGREKGQWKDVRISKGKGPLEGCKK
jgi:hypothetical protein